MLIGQDIIEQVIKYTGLKAPSLAASIGVSYQRIYDIQRGKTLKLSNIVATGLATAYPELNKNWLLTGEGEMILDPSSRNKEPKVVYITEGEELSLTTTNDIKYYELSDGRYRMRVPLILYTTWTRFINEKYKQIRNEEDEQWDSIEFIVPIIGHGKYYGFEVKGDSMDVDSKRSISHGDFVLARELDREYWNEELKYKKYPYWIIVLENSILCKQIVGHNVETGSIILHSLSRSPEYQDFAVNLNQVHGLYNIIQKQTVQM